VPLPGGQGLRMPDVDIFTLHHPWPEVLRVLTVLVLVVSVLRWSDDLVRWTVARIDRHYDESADTAQLTGLKRRETVISLVRTTLRYIVILIAVAVIFEAVTGAGTITAVAGASLIVLLIGFSGQRFLTDILTGAFMMFEGWYTVGDLVVVEPWKLEGVVEEVSLRATTIRAVNGERQRVHNSQVMAVRVLPRGVREFEIEVLCSDEDEGRAVIDAVARMMPTGPLQFVRRPRLIDTERLNDDMIRLRAGAATAAGREWLATEFLPHVMKERAAEGLIVHGPVVTEVDVSSAPSKYYQRYYGSGRSRAGA
jgi:moderate conductance mechanosensitive channel